MTKEQTIAQVIFNELQIMEDQSKPVYIHKQGRSLSYDEPEGSHTLINDEAAKQFIQELVYHDLEKHDEVFLYICNAKNQIIIEDFTQAERDHNDIYDAYTLSEYPKLYIARDN